MSSTKKGLQVAHTKEKKSMPTSNPNYSTLTARPLLNRYNAFSASVIPFVSSSSCRFCSSFCEGKVFVSKDLTEVFFVSLIAKNLAYRLVFKSTARLSASKSATCLKISLTCLTFASSSSRFCLRSKFCPTCTQIISFTDRGARGDKSPARTQVSIS